ncbi:hypothetical protein [Maribacter litoralis]|uniref:hypothetical protein n=1 Tax=Maribacter litoralis TaxID=2059726 RepID=UPI003F5CD015
MKNTSIICLSLLILTLGCTKNSGDILETKAEQPKEEEVEVIAEPVIVTYLTIKTGCLLNYGNQGNWIIVYDESGNLIDYKPFQENEIIAFDSDETETHEKYSVTFLAINEFLGSIWNRLNTSTEVSMGSTLDFSCIEENNASNFITGNFNLKIKNVPDDITVTSINASNGENVGFAYSESSNNGLMTYEADLNILEVKTDYIITIQDGNENAKFYVLENYEIGEEVSINYEDFNSYTDYTDIKYPEHTSLRLLLHGSNTNEVYSLSQAFSNGNTQGSLRLGKLNRFDTYNLLYEIKINSEYEYSFENIGEFPKEIITPLQPTITILNSSIQEFKFETSISDYQSKTSSWHYGVSNENYTTWDITSSKAYNPVIGYIPTEISTLHSNLDIEDLIYQQTKFVLNDDETIILSN